MTYELAGWTVDPTRNLIGRGGTRSTLEPRAMELLIRLVAARGAVVSKEALLRDVWHDRIVVEHVLPKTVSSLRRALGESARQPRIIQTVPKRGYRIACPVRVAAAAPARRRLGWASLTSSPAGFAWLALVMLAATTLPVPSSRDSAPATIEAPIKIAIATGLEPGLGHAAQTTSGISVEAKLRHKLVWAYDWASDHGDRTGASADRSAISPPVRP